MAFDERAIDSKKQHDYDWIIIELIDQYTRNYSGGEMLKYFIRNHVPNEKFVIERCGTVAKQLIEEGKRIYLDSIKTSDEKQNVDLQNKTILNKKLSFIKMLKLLKRIPVKILNSLRNFFLIAKKDKKAQEVIRREEKLKKLLGEEYFALQVGRFRLSGEVHQWIYDTYNISKILEELNFTNVVIRDAYTSYVKNWTSFNLDTEPDGSIYKPDSGYVEAIK